MVNRPRNRPRRSRDEVSEALIDAAAVLYAEHSSTQVTIRAITAAAGVNVSMVNRYFGSKDNLVRAVLERTQADLADLTSEVRDVHDDIDLLFRGLLADNAFVAVLARACLDDAPQLFPESFPVTDFLIDRLTAAHSDAGVRGIDPQIVVACIESLALGYGLYGPYIRRATRLDDRPAEAIEEGIVEVLRRVIDTVGSTQA